RGGRPRRRRKPPRGVTLSGQQTEGEAGATPALVALGQEACPMTLPLRRRTTAAPAAALAAAALLLALLPASGASAQAAPPTIAVEQGYGFATVSWSPVADADAYEIERSPVDGDEPSGPGEVVGVWTPDRYPYTGGQLTFADSGF